MKPIPNHYLIEKYRYTDENCAIWYLNNEGRVFSKKTLFYANHGRLRSFSFCFAGDLANSFSIQYIVAELYIPNPKNKLYVIHKDYDITNQALTNLKWVYKPEFYLRNYIFLSIKVARRYKYLKSNSRKLSMRDIKDVVERYNVSTKTQKVHTGFHLPNTKRHSEKYFNFIRHGI